MIDEIPKEVITALVIYHNGLNSGLIRAKTEENKLHQKRVIADFITLHEKSKHVI